MLAYGGAAAEQSEGCLNGISNSIDQYEGDLELAFEDASLSFGFSDVSGQVQQMADANGYRHHLHGLHGATTIAQEMERQGLDAVQYMPRAYDYDFIAPSSVTSSRARTSSSPAPRMGASTLCPWRRSRPGWPRPARTRTA